MRKIAQAGRQLADAATSSDRGARVAATVQRYDPSEPVSALFRTLPNDLPAAHRRVSFEAAHSEKAPPTPQRPVTGKGRGKAFDGPWITKPRHQRGSKGGKPPKGNKGKQKKGKAGSKGKKGKRGGKGTKTR